MQSCGSPPQHANCRDAGFLRIAFVTNTFELRVPAFGVFMGRVTVCAANIVAPVLSTPEIVVLFSTGMASKANLRGCLGRFILERDDLRGIAFRKVCLAGTVTGLATGHFSVPTLQGCELGV